MRALKSVSLASLLAFCSSSVLAETVVNTAKGEVLLELQATGRISQKADIIEMSCTLEGSGVDNKAALSNLERRKGELATALLPQGIASDAISYPSPAEVSTHDDYMGAAEDAAIYAGTAALEAAEAGAVAGAATGDRAPNRRQKTPRVVEIDFEQAAIVKMSSLKQLRSTREIMAKNHCRNGELANYGISDPDGATVKAKDAAIVEARKQADHYAETLGLKVLRVARIGEYSPVSALIGPELSQMIMGYSAMATNNNFNGRSRDNFRLFGFGTSGDEYVTAKVIWVDFVLTPK
jgi:uncharacterized protein YggE